jgi:hypothetical protein
VAQCGGEIQSLRDAAIFTPLTDGPMQPGNLSTHAWLVEQWKTSMVTTCMQFAGAYGKNLGYGRGKPGGYMGSFYVDTSPYTRSAWIAFKDKDTTKPKDGDVVVFSNAPKKEHMGVSVTFNDDKWITLESGQGTIGKYDSIKKKEQDWGSRTMKGWIDLDLYFAGASGGQKSTSGKTGSLWLNEDGDIVHPDAPQGSGGKGFFRAGNAARGLALRDGLPNPWSPAGSRLDPLAIQKAEDELNKQRGEG